MTIMNYFMKEYLHRLACVSIHRGGGGGLFCHLSPPPPPNQWIHVQIPAFIKPMINVLSLVEYVPAADRRAQLICVGGAGDVPLLSCASRLRSSAEFRRQQRCTPSEPEQRCPPWSNDCSPVNKMANNRKENFTNIHTVLCHTFRVYFWDCALGGEICNFVMFSLIIAIYWSGNFREDWLAKLQKIKPPRK